MIGSKKLLQRLDTAWTAFKESYAGLTDAQILEHGVTGDWSVRDIIAHVTTWEEEALKHLPLIIAAAGHRDTQQPMAVSMHSMRERPNRNAASRSPLSVSNKRKSTAN